MGIIVIGWIVARILRALTAKVVAGWSRRFAPRLARLVGAREAKSNLFATVTGRSVARALEGLVFWVVLFLALTIAADVLDLDVVSEWLAILVGFLPRVLGALLVVFLGIVIGSMVRAAVEAGATRAGFAYPQLLGLTARGGVLLVSAIVAFDQVGLEIGVLIVMVAVISGAMLSGAALAFGLGARDSVSNILASHYLLRIFEVGHRIRIGEIEGRILEITPTCVVVEDGDDRAVIPASRFSEQVATLLSK